MGSVKDLKILEKAQMEKPGYGQFIFSDRYSVFDWGEMPDNIDDKGKALAILSAYFLEKLEENGVKTHYIGINENNSIKRIKELSTPSNSIEVSIVRVVKPILKDKEYDYTPFENEKNNYLIPFEIIYRNQLPEGSSVFKRLERGEVTFEYLGLKEAPVPGQVLESPIYDISTKLEIDDRYMTWEEAQKIAYLSTDEIENTKKMVQLANEIITSEMDKIGLVNEDGKIELAFNENREMIVVDTLGTLDECRFKYKGYPISKEMARKHYRKTDWFKKVEEAKKEDRFKWKEIVGEDPEPLPPEFKELFANMYRAVTNQVTGKEFFANVPDLDTIIAGLEKFI
jgi:phosphoribosylaminoimidazole-succinocarboxamide synthase